MQPLFYPYQKRHDERMKRLTVPVLLFYFLGAGLAMAEGPAKDKPPWGKVTEYGLFLEANSGALINKADTPTGKAILGAVLEFDKRTDRVPLKTGVIFGYRYWLKIPSGPYWAELRRVLIHPPMLLPDGSITTRSERVLRKRTIQGIVTTIDAYALNEDYELVEGDWVFQLWYGEDKLTEQRFTTYRSGVSAAGCSAGSNQE